MEVFDTIQGLCYSWVVEKAIIVNHLVKNFDIVVKPQGFAGSISSLLAPRKKVTRAVRDISFTIEQGELVGFIGPNGAGKTTTLKVLSGLLYPTAGFIQVLGYDPWERKPDYLKQISLVMGQKNQLWWDLPAIETFELNRAIYEIPENKFKDNLNKLVDLLEVKNILNIQVRRLSLGQRMRLELIAALLHQPKVLFLDEPTIGLDVVGQQKVREFIREYNTEFNSTILLTSHNTSDVANLAKRVVVIDKGELIFDGELKELTDKFAKRKLIKIELSREIDIKKLEDIGKVIEIQFPQATISVPKEASAFAASELLQNFPIGDLTIEEEPLEGIIRRIFKGELIKRPKR